MQENVSLQGYIFTTFVTFPPHCTRLNVVNTGPKTSRTPETTYNFNQTNVILLLLVNFMFPKGWPKIVSLYH